MKKNILALLLSLVAISTLSARSVVTYEYDDYDDEDDVEVVYEYETPVRTRYVRRPAVREIVYEPAVTEVHYVDSDPGAAVASGLIGFGLGTALGAACSR